MFKTIFKYMVLGYVLVFLFLVLVFWCSSSDVIIRVLYHNSMLEYWKEMILPVSLRGGLFGIGYGLVMFYLVEYNVIKLQDRKVS